MPKARLKNHTQYYFKTNHNMTALISIILAAVIAAWITDSSYKRNLIARKDREIDALQYSNNRLRVDKGKLQRIVDRLRQRLPL